MILSCSYEKRNLLGRTFIGRCGRPRKYFIVRHADKSIKVVIIRNVLIIQRSKNVDKAI